jgi:imidazolonepropionase
MSDAAKGARVPQVLAQPSAGFEHPGVDHPPFAHPVDPATPAPAATPALTPILITNARALTLLMGRRPRRGDDLAELSILPRADVLIENGKISGVMPSPSALRDIQKPGVRVIDANGDVLMPGLIDCHTHACWAGSRIDEWEQKLAGASYLDILKRGGGIMSTVNAVRKASQAELTSLLLERLFRMLENGTTTIEVKSGYGLSTHDEIKMLRAIHDAAPKFPGTIIATALLGHALDPAEGREDFIRKTIHETLPAVSSEFPRMAIDAYCETAAWSPGECQELFDAAIAREHPIRVHCDQFNSLGMTSTAALRGYMSVDHLEAVSPAQVEALGKSGTAGVLLPVCGFHLDGRYAPARALASKGVILAIASNLNPGSAPCYSMQFVIQVAVRNLGLSVGEAIAASTVNAAHVLGMADRGVIGPGQRADLLLLKTSDERELAYEVGLNHARLVIVGGRVVRER